MDMITRFGWRSLLAVMIGMTAIGCLGPAEVDGVLADLDTTITTQAATVADLDAKVARASPATRPALVAERDAAALILTRAQNARRELTAARPNAAIDAATLREVATLLPAPWDALAGTGLGLMAAGGAWWRGRSKTRLALEAARQVITAIETARVGKTVDLATVKMEPAGVALVDSITKPANA